MKKLLLLACIAFIVGCSDDKTETKTGDTKMGDSSKEKLDYPYTTDHAAEYWIPGDPKNAWKVLTSLKAFENGNTDEAASYFGDSVELRFDYMRRKVSNDTLKAVFKQWRGMDSSVVIKMGDWESVIGNDKKEEWVTLWYKEIHTDKHGKTDSTNVVDDVKIVNGKIVVLDEKLQHFPKK